MAGNLKFANNIYATLAAGINAVATSISLTSGQGTRFGFLVNASDYCWATLIHPTTNALEIIKVVGPPSGDTLPSIVRGQDGTTALSFTAGDRIEVRIPNAALVEIPMHQLGVVTSVAVAATVTLPVTGGNMVHLTAGGASISAFAAYGPSPVWTIFDVVAHLVNSATFILPTGADIYARAGDVAMWMEDPPFSGTWRCLDYRRADGGPLTVGMMLNWPQMTSPSWAVGRDGSALSRTGYPALYAKLCPVRNGTLSSGLNTVTGLSSTADMYVGMPLEGANIPAATTVASITSTSAITMSAVASGSGGTPITFFPWGYGTGGDATTFGVMDDRENFERGWAATPQGHDQSEQSGTLASGSPNVTGLTSTVGLLIGQAVTGTGIAANTTVLAITGTTTITLSQNATANGAQTLTFSGRAFGTEQADTYPVHTHTPSIGSLFATVNPAGPGFIQISNGGAYNGVFYASLGNAGNGAETRPRNRAYLPIIVY